jgi:peptidyl-prolyl cis-trans isomerase A (cyclophilin A)
MIKKALKFVFVIVTASVVLLLVSCDPARKYEKAEKDAINNYLRANDTINYEKKPSGLYYHEVLAGTGLTPVAHDTVYVVYTGKFLDGTVFDSNVGKASLVFPIGEYYMLAGFEEQISYMKEGGKSTAVLPSDLAYGSQGRYPVIDGYTALLFDVQLVKVGRGPSK